MKKSILSKIMVILFTTLLLSQIGTISFANKNNIPLSTNFVRSYWVRIRSENHSENIIFYQDKQGYRGYIQKIAYLVHGDYDIGVYEGMLYHPSVKDIPILANNKDDTFNSNSKYVTKVVSYSYDPEDYLNHDKFPKVIFYNDGVYKGYLEHTSDLPIDKKRSVMEVTYGGYVYRGNNYPEILYVSTELDI